MLKFEKAPITAYARHFTTLGGVRVYLMHKAGRGGGHYASISAIGGIMDVIAFPEGASFSSQAKLKNALTSAHERGETVVNTLGVGAMLKAA